MPNGPSYQAGGALLPGDALYVRRAADHDLLEALANDEFCFVLAPRQIGKSSLLAQTVEILRAPDRAVRVATANLQAGADVRSEKEWYEGVIRQLADTAAYNPGFVMPFQWEEWLERQTGPYPQRFVAFLREAFLDASPGRWVVAIDEIDATLNLPFSASFFAAVRLCHDNRPGQPVFRRLSFILLGVATPSELIQHRTRTPFNIGRRIEMTDFTSEEAGPLAAALPLPPPLQEAAIRRVFHWTDGQPYLTQAVCDELTSAWRRSPPPTDTASVETAVDENVGEQFFSIERRSQNAHFGYIDQERVKKFPQRAGLLKTYRLALEGAGLEDVPRSRVIAELKISGLAKAATADRRLRVRNRIYARVFDDKWIRESMPANWQGHVTVASVLGLALVLTLGWSVLKPQAEQEARVLALSEQIERAEQDVPTVPYEQLRILPGQQERADELMAQYWQRHALVAEQTGRRDEVALLWLKSRVYHDSPERQLATRMALEAPIWGLAAIFRHDDSVKSASFSADGRRVVTASRDKTARVWDLTTGKAVCGPLQHDAPVTSAVFSADGTKVVTTSEDKTAKIWNATTGTALGKLLLHEDSVWSATFSADGRRIITSSRGARGARVWDAATGEAVGEPLPQMTRGWSAAFSANGRRVVAATDETTAQIWDAVTSKVAGDPMRHAGYIWDAEFSADGSRLVTASVDKTARIWDTTTGRAVGKALRHADIVRIAAFSPDGRRIATAEGDTVRMWDASTCEVIGALRHDYGVRSLAFSTDGQRVVTTSYNTARIWDTATGKDASESLYFNTPAESAAFSADGSHIFTLCDSDNDVRIWNVSASMVVGVPLRHEPELKTAVFSANGMRVVTVGKDHTARIWDAATGKALGEPLRHKGEIRRAVFSADGSRVATASFDNTAQVWDAATGKALGEPLRHKDWVWSAVFSADGSLVVTVSSDKTARIWDATTGKALGEPLQHKDDVWSVAFSADARRLVTVSADETARIWDTATSKEVGEPLQHEYDVTRAVFSPDGNRVVTASGDIAKPQGEARLWDAATGKAVGEPLRHEGKVASAVFSADGSLVVTSGWDKIVRIWDAATGEPVGEPLSHENWLLNAAFSVDGKWIVTQTYKCIRWWERTAPDRFQLKGIRWTRGNAWEGEPLVAHDGQLVKVVESIPRGTVVVRTLLLSADDLALPVLSGSPAELLAEWLRRLGLKFEDEIKSPKLLPAYGLPDLREPPKPP